MSEENAPKDISRRRFFKAGGGAAAVSMLVPSLLTREAMVGRAAIVDGSAALACYDGDQYKRRGLNAMVNIADGHYDAAVRCLKQHLEVYPGDPEFHYGLDAAYAQKGALDQATDHARQALRAGLPPSRLLAGPRALFAPLANHSAYQRLMESHDRGPVHGPLLGSVTERSARFWVRTAREVPVQIEVRGKDEETPLATSEETVARPNRDYTAVLRVDGLAPGTAYDYAGHQVNFCNDEQRLFT